MQDSKQSPQNIDLFNLLFKDPAEVLERINHARRAVARELADVERITMNPDLLNGLRLFGLEVRWDSTLDPGEIRLRSKDQTWSWPGDRGFGEVVEARIIEDEL